MEKSLSLIFDYFLNAFLILILILVMLFFSYYMMLRNITVKVCKEAEITGVITSDFVNNTYENNPLSSIPGEFQILEVSPALNTNVERLGDKLSIRISKDITFGRGIHVTLTAKGRAVNQGYYGNGYRAE